MPNNTLILVHGATCNRRMWDAVRRGLDPGFRVIAPDLPGHGARRHEKFTLDGAVATVVAAAASVTGAPVVLAGDSLGGYTSLASAAALDPKQLKGLFLGGCSSNLAGLALAPYLIQSAIFKVLIALRGEENLIATSASKLISDQRMSQIDVDAMVGAGLSLKVFSEAVDAIRNIDFRKILAAIPQPVLIVNGERDRGHMRQESSFLAVSQHGEIHHFPDCKHGVTIRRARECAVLLNAFAARVCAS